MKEYVVYLDEIRKRSLPIIVVFVLGLFLGFIFSNKILIFCLNLFNFSGVNVTVTSPTQLIDLSIYTSLLCGLLLALPFFIYQLIVFVKPAFKPHEYSLIKKMLPLSLMLLVSGSVFGAWVTQFIIAIYSRFSAEFQVSNMWDIQKFFSQVVVTALLMGIIFQLPIILTILIRVGLINQKFLVAQRRYVYAILLIVCVILPPTDILSLVLLVTPLIFLFEIALLLNRNSVNYLHKEDPKCLD